MPQTSAPGLVLQGLQTAVHRICECGCRRDISDKRAGARFFDGTCRKRALRDRIRAAPILVLGPPRCRCGNRTLAEIDVDGDLRCVTCGRQLRHVATPLSNFDALAWLMITDGDGRPILPPQRRRLPGGWRVVAVA